MISYTILGSKQKEAEEICLNLFRKGKKFGSVFASYLKRIEIDDDFFFKGAPLVIVVAHHQKPQRIRYGKTTGQFGKDAQKSRS